MGIIHVMDEHLSNMIAAGEVVERPASVVKELVENAIDAKADRIEVHIEEGGLHSIRVVDNGQGMDREDCILAFQRHATSKIRSPRDLFHIRSLGFRGEALPSIAAVSRLELTSGTASGQVGTKLTVEGGAVKEVVDTAVVQGTEVVVRDLFYNTPARLKYMKSISTEVGHVSDTVNRLALSHPSIAFTLAHNGNILLKTSGDGKLLHVMAAIYGVQTAKLLLPISGESLDFRWEGYLSKTEVTRANRSYISTIVNGRFVRNYPLTGAILRGYHTLLPTGRYPIVVLSVEMDPALVDVNVHPAKLEVRFSKELELCEEIQASVSRTLREGLRIVQPLASQKKPLVREKTVQPQLDLSRAPLFSKQGPSVMYHPGPWRTEAGARIRESLYGPVDLARDRTEATAASGGNITTGEHLPPQPDSSCTDPAAPLQTQPQDGPSAAKPGDETPPRLFAPTDGQTEGVSMPVEPEGAVPLFYPVGQVHGTYIVAQNETGMYLIDQHAAQERIFYEYFMEKLREEDTSSQLLLFPHTVECTAAEAEKLKKRLELLRSFGLEIEWFGSRTFLVRSHPHWFPEGSELEVIDELIRFVLEAGEEEYVDIVKMREKAAILMSCKASIKANQFLTQAEMEALIARLRETSSPFTCPHGRPIVVHFSVYDLQKMFKRVM